MARKYLRSCDNCGKEIENMYDFGVTTLYRDIRVGRGGRFVEYGNPKNIRSGTEITNTDDYDDYGTSNLYNDDAKEFNFCSPECCFKFLIEIYNKAYSEPIISVENKKLEKELKKEAELVKKKLGSKIPFFRQIQTKFSHKFFKDSAIEKGEKLIKNLRGEIKKLKGSHNPEKVKR